MANKDDLKKTLENKDLKNLDLENFGLGDLANKLIIETLNYVNGQWLIDSPYCTKEKHNEDLSRQYIKKTQGIIKILNQREQEYKNKPFSCEIDY